MVGAPPRSGVAEPARPRRTAGARGRGAHPQGARRVLAGQQHPAGHPGAGRGTAWRVAEMRSKLVSCLVDGEVNRAICEALIGLSAKTAVVLSGDLERGGLRSIPEVGDAVRDAWLSPRGLERQIAAVARGEDLPTWPCSFKVNSTPSTPGGPPTKGEQPSEGKRRRDARVAQGGALRRRVGRRGKSWTQGHSRLHPGG